MSSDSGKSRRAGWIAAVLVAVPVLYALSVAPIYYFTHSVGHLDYDKTPRWLDAYANPYWFVYLRLPSKAQEIPRAYDVWWARKVGGFP